MRERKEDDAITIWTYFIRNTIAWIGVSDTITEGTYRYESWVVPSWTNWKAIGIQSGLPEPRGHVNKDCGVMDLDDALFEWEIRSCSDNHPFICEYNVTQSK